MMTDSLLGNGSLKSSAKRARGEGDSESAAPRLCQESLSDLKKPEYKSGVIITGAASGIGLATAKLLVRDYDYCVFMIDRDEEKLKKEATELNMPYFRCDLSDPREIDNLQRIAMHKAAEGYYTSNGWRYLIHCAGCEFCTDVNVGRFGSAETAEALQPNSQHGAAVFDRAMHVNLRSVYLVTRALLPLLKHSLVRPKDVGSVAAVSKPGSTDSSQSLDGSIIAVSSVQAHRSFPDYAAYAATKGGMISMCRQMAGDLARFNIRVNTVSPGAVATNFASNSMKHERKFQMGGFTPNNSDDLLPTPTGGLLEILSPERVAEAIVSMLFMRGVTGQDLVVDGGCSVIGTAWWKPFLGEEEYPSLMDPPI